MLVLPHFFPSPFTSALPPQASPRKRALTPVPFAAPASKVVKFHDVTAPATAVPELTLCIVLRTYTNDGTLLHDHLSGQVTQIVWSAEPVLFEYAHRVAPCLHQSVFVLHPFCKHLHRSSPGLGGLSEGREIN